MQILYIYNIKYYIFVNKNNIFQENLLNFMYKANAFMIIEILYSFVEDKYNTSIAKTSIIHMQV